MAKIKNQPIEEHILVSPLEEIMGDRFGRYSKYIIQDRALPDARDGLKPVQRRILYAMNSDGNTHLNKYRKSAKSVGLIMGNFHPHGDSSIYEAMVRMSQDWKSAYPLIDMQGNNGSIDDDPAAAMRYTEARLSPIAQMLLGDIDKDTVNWAPNFDDTEQEPTVLPARYPHLLINGINGIAAGYATNIPPHNLGEVIDATIYRIQFPHCELDELMQYVQGPDFPTGGIVQGKQGIIDAFTTGKGRVIIRGHHYLNETKTINQIIIDEIPYDVIKCNMVKKMDDIRINKELDGIIDVRDESDRNGLKIVIDIKKDVDPELVLNYMYKNTELQVSYNYNVIAIVDKRPMQLGLAAMLDAFIHHREEVILRRSRYEYTNKEKRCHILEGLIRCISVLDEVIHLIRASKDKTDAKHKLIDAFAFSEIQAEAIVTLRLYRLSNTDVTALKEEYARLLNEMESLNEIINEPKMLRKLMINELKEVKKQFALVRRSRIEDEVQEIVIDKEAMIANDRIMVTISRDGYAKRVSLRSYGASESQLTGTKEGDEVIGVAEVNTLDTLLFTTQRGTYGYLQMYEIDECKWKELGTHLNAKLKMSGDEKIVNAFVLPNLKQDGYLLSVSRHGLIKKTRIVDFEVGRNNKTYTAMNLHSADELIATCICYDSDEVVLTTRNGFALRYPLEQIPSSNPKSKGVKAMNLNGDEIIGSAIVKDHSQQLVLISESGSTKRLKMDDVVELSRPAKGQLIHKRVKSNPNFIRNMLLVKTNDDILLANGDLHTIKAGDVALMGKDATFSNTVNINAETYPVKGLVMVDDHPFSETDADSEEQISMNL